MDFGCTYTTVGNFEWLECVICLKVGVEQMHDGDQHTTVEYNVNSSMLVAIVHQKYVTNSFSVWNYMNWIDKNPL